MEAAAASIQVQVNQQSEETITTLAKGTKIAPPHVIEGGPTSANLVPTGENEEPPAMKRLKQLKDKADHGGILNSEEELELARIVGMGMI